MRLLRIIFILSAAALGVSNVPVASAQTKVHTESIRPPAAAQPLPEEAKPQTASPSRPDATPLPEVITDLSRLPEPVARMRQRILDAARSGILANLVNVMRSNETMPVFSLDGETDPIAYWRANYPDSDGVEVLSILLDILEAPYVHVDVGTPQEAYVWPYFARMPMDALTPAQRVDLFRIITGADYKDMRDFGAYNFYRLGIGPDGTWHYFVAGD